MSFDVTKLIALSSGPAGQLVYAYDAGTDLLRDVIVAGYFNNKDDTINLVAGDRIFVTAADGNMWIRVSAVSASAGDVTTRFAGGMPPINTPVGSASGALLVGYTEKDSGTASAHVLPAPYPNAEVIVHKTGSATAGQSFVTDATSTTLNGQGDRTITLNEEGEGFRLIGSSTSRWRIAELVHSDAGAALS